MPSVKPKRISVPFCLKWPELIVLTAISFALCFSYPLNSRIYLQFILIFILAFLAYEDIVTREISHSALALFAVALAFKALWLGEFKPWEAAVCSGMFIAIELFLRWGFHREGMGFGDIKLLCILSLYLGYLSFTCLIFALGLSLVAYVACTLIHMLCRSDKALDTTFPLVPALSLSFIICDLLFIEKAVYLYELITLAW